jgi:hypothetical protein
LNVNSVAPSTTRQNAHRNVGALNAVVTSIRRRLCERRTRYTRFIHI